MSRHSIWFWLLGGWFVYLLLRSAEGGTAAGGGCFSGCARIFLILFVIAIPVAILEKAGCIPDDDEARAQFTVQLGNRRADLARNVLWVNYVAGNPSTWAVEARVRFSVGRDMGLGAVAENDALIQLAPESRTPVRRVAFDLADIQRRGIANPLDTDVCKIHHRIVSFDVRSPESVSDSDGLPIAATPDGRPSNIATLLAEPAADTADRKVTEARLFLRAGCTQEAIRKLDGAIALSPEHAAALSLIAQLKKPPEKEAPAHAHSPKPAREIEARTTFSFDATVTAIAFSPRDGSLMAGDSRGKVVAWQLSEATPPKVLQVHDGKVLAIAVSARGDAYLTGGADGFARLTHRSGARLASHSVGGAVTFVAFTPRDESLCTGGSSRCVWSLDGRQLSRLNGPAVQGGALAPDGEHLAVGVFVDRRTSRVDLLPLRSNETIRSIELRNPTGWRSVTVAYSPRDEVAVSSGVVKVLRASTWTRLLVIPIAARSLAFSPHGRFLAVGKLYESRTRKCTIWDIDAQQQVLVFRSEGPELDDGALVSFSPDGKHLAIAGGRTIAVVELPEAAADVCEPGEHTRKE